MNENEKQTQEVNELVNELRATLESKKADSADAKEKVKKIEEKLDELENDNQKLTTQLLGQEKKELEAKERLEAMEKIFYRTGNGIGTSTEKSFYRKAFDKYLQLGEKKLDGEEVGVLNRDPEKLDKYLTSDERKYLRTDDDTGGGYLCPYDYVQEIIKKITEVSPIRTIARVRTTTRESVLLPIRENIVSGYWVGEGGDYTESNSTYGMNEIKTHKLCVFSDTTVEMLKDAVFNMATEIDQDIVESFARLEGLSFVSGDGVAKPTGILATSGLQTLNSGVANDILPDNLLEIAGELKVGYNPIYLLNRRTIARIRRFKDGIGQYIWQAGLAGTAPNTINGYPYVSTIDIPDITPDNIAVIFGDIMRGYTIIDNVQLFMLRDDFTQATKGKVRFVAWKRVGGQVTLKESIKLLKVAV